MFTRIVSKNENLVFFHKFWIFKINSKFGFSNFHKFKFSKIQNWNSPKLIFSKKAEIIQKTRIQYDDGNPYVCDDDGYCH